MKVYVAGRVSELDRVQRVQRLVRSAGHTISFDWTQWGSLDADHTADPRKRYILARKERDGVADADFLILCWNDHEERSMLGALLETGMAMGAGKRVILLGCDRESVFWSIGGVFRVDDEAALARLIGAPEEAVAA